MWKEPDDKTDFEKSIEKQIGSTMKFAKLGIVVGLMWVCVVIGAVGTGIYLLLKNFG